MTLNTVIDLPNSPEGYVKLLQNCGRQNTQHVSLYNIPRITQTAYIQLKTYKDFK
jgi:hypothetical protein